MDELLTIKEASEWASDFLLCVVSESNILYLIQYGKVKKHNGGNSFLLMWTISKITMTHIKSSEK
ncbi:MAG: hypothetical protein CO127_07985 [Ignavibacteria bacterium CG_4_9_14_3_um_filter_36_18]|nr:hypothetical protein [Ignavibacteria bacterium]PJB00608.1 MAG: hypothetical protein CO127_07985 [Ignavibacteria bacterium CG_4_9_14_3_um_filter_36_18]